MVIVLRNSDFSENNIGQIDIPIVLSEWTEDVISKFVNFSWNKEKKIAVERFYLSIKENNIISRLKYLSLPMLGTTIQEAVQNIVSGNDAVIGANSSVKYNIVSKKGIKRIAPVSENADIIYVPFSVSEDHSNFHVMSMPSEMIPSGSYLPASTNLGDYNDLENWQSIGCGFTFDHAVNVCTLGRWNSAGYTDTASFIPTSMTGNSGSAVTSDPNFSMQPVPLLQNVVNNKVYISIAAQDYNSTDALTNFRTDTANPQGMSSLRMLLMPLEDSNGNWYSRPYCAFSYGKSLTNEQSKVYQKALIELFSVISK